MRYTTSRGTIFDARRIMIGREPFSPGNPAHVAALEDWDGQPGRITRDHPDAGKVISVTVPPGAILTEATATGGQPAVIRTGSSTVTAGGTARSSDTDMTITRKPR